MTQKWKNLVANEDLRRYLLPASLLFLLVLHAFGGLEGVLSILYKGKIDQANTEYLQESDKRSAAAFLVLSGIKDAVGVLESSTAGISFGAKVDVQLGKALRSVTETVDLAWKASLAGMACNFGMSILQEVADFLATPLTWVLLLAALASCVTSRWFPARIHIRRSTLKVTELLLVLVVSLYLFLPVSIYTAGRLSQAILHPTYHASMQHFSEIHEHLEPLKTQIVQHISDIETPPDADADTAEPVPTKKDGIIHRVEDDVKDGLQRIEHLVEKPFVFLKHKWDKIHALLQEVREVLHAKVEHLNDAAPRLLAVILFESILFPLGMLYLLYRLARSVLAHVFSRAELDRFRTVLEERWDELEPRLAKS